MRARGAIILAAAVVLSARGASAFSSPAASSSREDSPEPERDYGRALVGTGTLLSLGILSYLAGLEDNLADWEYDLSLTTLRRKLITLEYVRFEDNNFFHNSLGHGVAGSLYHNAWRASGFSPLESAIAGLSLSVLWEVAVEFQEVASLNDLIVTTGAGVPVGEAAHKWGSYLLSDRASIGRTVAAVLIDPPLAIGRWLDPPASTEETSYEERVHASSRLELGLGASDAESSDVGRAEIEVRLLADLVDHPGFGRAASIRDSFANAGVFLDLSLTMANQAGLADLHLLAEYLYLAHLDQRLDFLGREASGHTVLFGLASTFEHRTHRVSGWRDGLAVVSPLGPSLKAQLFDGPLGLTASASIFPDFAVVRSVAAADYAERHGLEGARSSLRERRYYYAFGLSVRGALSVGLEPIHASVESTFHAFRSIDGRDRFEETVTQDLRLTDVRTQTRVGLRFAPGPGIGGLSFAFERLAWDGTIGALRSREREDRYLAILGLRL